MKDEWVRTIRTAAQVAVAISASAPVLVPALGLSVTTGVGAVVVMVATAITRVMQIPEVSEILNKYLKIPKP